MEGIPSFKLKTELNLKNRLREIITSVDNDHSSTGLASLFFGGHQQQQFFSDYS